MLVVRHSPTRSKELNIILLIILFIISLIVSKPYMYHVQTKYLSSLSTACRLLRQTAIVWSAPVKWLICRTNEIIDVPTNFCKPSIIPSSPNSIDRKRCSLKSDAESRWPKATSVKYIFVRLPSPLSSSPIRHYFPRLSHTRGTPISASERRALTSVRVRVYTYPRTSTRTYARAEGGP